jgi:hypothetical protein
MSCKTVWVASGSYIQDRHTYSETIGVFKTEAAAKVAAQKWVKELKYENVDSTGFDEGMSMKEFKEWYEIDVGWVKKCIK